MIKQKLLLFSFATATLFLTSCTQLMVSALNQIELTRISVQDDKMYLLGDFNSQSYDQVRASIEANPNIKTIVLTANSGSLDDETTFKLWRYLRDKGLNTHLLGNSVIASGAVDLFLSGVSRTIEKGAKLGVHSWSDGSKQGKDIPKDNPVHDLNATYIKDMLGNDEFYWFTIYSASADSIYWMKENEIQKFQLQTGSFLPASDDETHFGEDFLLERKIIFEDS